MDKTPKEQVEDLLVTASNIIDEEDAELSKALRRFAHLMTLEDSDLLHNLCRVVNLMRVSE